MHKQIGLVGLGKMGGNLSQQLLRKSWEVIGYNRSCEKTDVLAGLGLKPAYSYDELIAHLSPPRLVWLMLPASEVDDALGELLGRLSRGDIIVEAGNSFYKATARRYDLISPKGVHFIDVGVSGGPDSMLNGTCLVVGGDQEMFTYLEPLYRDVTVEGGYHFFPGRGAGHFVKMLHNGIEYGMMQAIAEGLAVAKASPYGVKASDVAHVLNSGSILQSSLLTYLCKWFEQWGEELDTVSGSVEQTGEGEWTVEAAKELGLDVPVLEDAVAFRKASQSTPSYTGKMLSAMRGQFGGHVVASKK